MKEMADQRKSGYQRIPVSPSLRFEIFKRDSFTCQYCGAKPPEAILHADHIVPVAEGGLSELMNLVTACSTCNGGKSDRLLNDSAVVERQRKQTADLADRREQLEMLVRWHSELARLDFDIAERLSEIFLALSGSSLNQRGRQLIMCVVKKFSLQEAIEAMETACNEYLVFGKNDKPTAESVEIALKRIRGICYGKRFPNGDRSRLYYIRGIIRNRFNYCDDASAIYLLRNAFDAGIPLGELEDWAKKATTWSEWKGPMMDDPRLNPKIEAKS